MTKKRKTMRKQKDKFGQNPKIKTIFKISDAKIIDMLTGYEIDPVTEDFDTLRAKTPEDLMRFVVEKYRFSDSRARISYSYPGGFRIKNLWQNVAKQSAATEEEIESNDKNIEPFMIQMLIVAVPDDLDCYNVNYWNQIYGKDYTEEYFKH